jgi:hypothetical protein
VATTKIKINSESVKALLKSDEIKADLQRRAENITAAAGEGFEPDVNLYPLRWRASVRTTTFEARKAEAEDRALSRALDAGRQ